MHLSPEEVEHLIFSIDEEDTVPRVMLYAKEQLGLDAQQIDARIRQALAEVLEGHHHHHFKRHIPLCRALSAVLDDLVAADRGRKQETAGRLF